MVVENYDQAAQVSRVAGFAFFETCNCGGTLRHCYRRAAMHLELLPNRLMFVMKENDKYGKQLYTGPFNELEKYLNEL